MARTKKASSPMVEEKLTSESLAAQTKQFLENGGKIQQIPNGVSGQVATSGPRHITLGKRHHTN